MSEPTAPLSIKVIDVRPGVAGAATELIVEVKVTPEMAPAVIRAFEEGRLAEFGVTQITQDPSQRTRKAADHTKAGRAITRDNPGRTNTR